MSVLTIDFVSDVICPWCFIGYRRLERALREEGAEDAVVTFHPFQLDPSTPPAGVDLREHLAQKYGADPTAMFARVEAVAREADIALDFAKVRKSPNTLRAHALIAAARELGPGVHRAVASAMFEAYFLEGRDLGDEEVLVDVAGRHGLGRDKAMAVLRDPASLEATAQQARSLSAEGVRSVPFAIFGGKVAVSGAQPLDVLRRTIARARTSGARPAPTEA